MAGPSAKPSPPQLEQTRAGPLAELPTDRALRLLHVEDDPALMTTVDRLLHDTLPAGSVIDPVGDLNQALFRLTTGRYDAILLDLSLPDSDGVSTVQAIRDHEADTPIIVLSGREDPNLAREAKTHGAKEVLFKSHLNGAFLDEMLRSALAAHSPSPDAPGGAKERRAAPRYLMTRSSIVIPMLADYRPAAALVATTLDISQTGAGLLVEEPSEPNWDRLVLGIERADGAYSYATAEMRHRRMRGAGCHIGVSFVPANDDPLSDARLALRFDPATCQFVAGLPVAILHEWALLGVLRPYLIDRVRSCPRCSGVPTFRDGCRECGSVRTSAVQYIHHFACAHVAPAVEFDASARLACPKCRARNLIVGADFEYLSGPIRCLDCAWQGNQLVPIGECLQCGWRFLGSEAPERDVIQFHVERLDPLAFVEAG